MKCALRAISIAMFMLLSANIFACLNLYVINEKGKESVYDDYPPYRVDMSPKNDLQSLKLHERWIREAEGEDDQYKTISNYAVYLIKLGHNKEALEILKKLARKHTKEYALLANLATAYELNGYPDSALKYMKQSLKIYPGSHWDSEWFHVRFLEATLQHRDKKTAIDDLNILKIDTAVSDKTVFGVTHQLHERIPLTSAPNAMLSKALEECGDYFRKQVSIDWSAKLYAKAIGFSTNEKATTRLWQKIESVRAKVVELNKKNSKAASRDQVRRQLLAANWRSYLQKDIDRWKAHKAHYEEKLQIMKL